MTESNSLINFGDLSKPATVLIEKVCGAVGVLYEPTRTRRQARAEVDAEKIRALARIELSEIEERAIERFVHQEARKQRNIEDITGQASALLGADPKPERLDDDWLSHFFQQCESVSDKEMQALWAKLLAGEATMPESFSKRTVDFVASIDKKDAALFTALGQFVWTLDEPTPIVLDMHAELRKSCGLGFSALKHLDAIGLISLESVAGYTAKGLPDRVDIEYHGRQVILEFQGPDENHLDVGKALLTTVGKELFPICGATPSDPFFFSVLEHWRSRGIKVHTPGYEEGKP